MKELLLRLLLRLEVIGNRHEEAGDTECRERMLDAVFRSFLRPEPGYELPDTYGLYAARANREVKKAIAEYVGAARVLAPSLGLTNFQQRLAAFQDSSVFTEDGTTFDEFFGAMAPQLYDFDGNLLKPR